MKTILLAVALLGLSACDMFGPMDVVVPDGGPVPIIYHGEICWRGHSVDCVHGCVATTGERVATDNTPAVDARTGKALVCFDAVSLCAELCH